MHILQQYSNPSIWSSNFWDFSKTAKLFCKFWKTFEEMLFIMLKWTKLLQIFSHHCSISGENEGGRWYLFWSSMEAGEVIMKWTCKQENLIPMLHWICWSKTISRMGKIRFHANWWRHRGTKWCKVIYKCFEFCAVAKKKQAHTELIWKSSS